jgi:hypothetical protein
MIQAGFPVRLSSDGGMTWSKPVVEEFSPFLSDDFAGRMVAFDIVDSGTLWVALNHCGLWRSEDNGFSWSPADAGITGTPSDSCQLAFSGRNQPADIFALELSAADADRIYVSTDHGVFTTTDGGNSWQSANGIAAQPPPAPPPGPFSGMADLSLSFFGVPSEFDPPTTIRFSGRITNFGPDPALQSQLSWGTTRVTSTTFGDCDSFGCYFDELASGATVELEFEIEILGGGIGAPCNGDVYSISAGVSALTEDPNTDNNQAVASMARVGNEPLISDCPGEGLLNDGGGGGGATDFTILMFLMLAVFARALRRRVYGAPNLP